MKSNKIEGVQNSVSVVFSQSDMFIQSALKMDRQLREAKVPVLYWMRPSL